MLNHCQKLSTTKQFKHVPVDNPWVKKNTINHHTDPKKKNYSFSHRLKPWPLTPQTIQITCHNSYLFFSPIPTWEDSTKKPSRGTVEPMPSGRILKGLASNVCSSAWSKDVFGFDRCLILSISRYGCLEDACLPIYPMDSHGKYISLCFCSTCPTVCLRCTFLPKIDEVIQDSETWNETYNELLILFVDDVCWMHFVIFR